MKPKIEYIRCQTQCTIERGNLDQSRSSTSWACQQHVRPRLHALTGEPSFRSRAEAVVSAFSGGVARNFFPFASLLNAAAFLERPLQIVVAGETAAERAGLRRAVLDVSLPDRVLTELAPGARLPEGHPAQGKGTPTGTAAAFVCAGPVCSLPISDADGLRQELERQ